MRNQSKIGETYIIDDPDNVCFGCGPNNARGLKLVFRRAAEHVVEVDYNAPADLCGAPHVIHGGIQATLLDEAMGGAARTAFGDEDVSLVTAELNIRYRLPALAEKALLVRAEMLRSKGRNVWVSGEIRSPEGEVLTRAEARWCRIA